MKPLVRVTGLLLLVISIIFAGEKEPNNRSFAVLFSGGGRYDDVRMCVATDAGVKGGPMADIILVSRFQLSENRALAFNLPVMRPVLFGLAFKMLQFEPEVNYEMIKSLKDNKAVISGIGLGVSFHYGPGYEADPDNRGDSFFAIGPIISCKLGMAFNSSGKKQKVIGIKAFYTPLFADKHSNGNVLGGALEFRFGF